MTIFILELYKDNNKIIEGAYENEQQATELAEKYIKQSNVTHYKITETVLNNLRLSSEILSNENWC